MPDEKCQRCGETQDDLRTLWMACLYDMSEMNLPFALRYLQCDEVNSIFTLLVCKNCRADWMLAIQGWFNTPPAEEPQTGYFVRELGATRERPLPPPQKIEERNKNVKVAD